MTHAEMESELADMCRELGLWCWISRDRQPRQTAGMVDALVLSYRAGLLAELKVADGRRTMAQVDVGIRIMGAGWAYRLWRPEHFTSGTVRAELENLQ